LAKIVTAFDLLLQTHIGSHAQVQAQESLVGQQGEEVAPLK
jgi:hypothetical protein